MTNGSTSWRSPFRAGRMWCRRVARNLNKTRDLYLVIVLLFLDVLSFSVALPILPLFIVDMVRQSMNAGVSEVDVVQRAAMIQGAVSGMDGIIKFICQPILGRLSDSYGRRRMLLLSQTGSMLCFTLYVIYPSVPTLFVSYTLHGFTQCTFAMGLSMVADRSAAYNNSLSLNNSSDADSKDSLLPMSRPTTNSSSSSGAQTGPSNNTPKSASLAGNFAMVNAAVGAGFVIGPSLGGLVSRVSSQGYEHHNVFLMSCCLFACSIIFGQIFVTESLPKEQRRPFTLSWADGPWNGFKMFCIGAGQIKLALCLLISAMAIGIYGVWALYCSHRFRWGPDMIGVLLSVNGVSLALSQTVFVGLIVPRFLGDKNAITLAFLANALMLTSVALAPTGRTMLIFVAIFGLIGGIGDPLLKALVAKGADASQQGALQGAMGSLFVLGQVFANFFYPSVFQHFINPEYQVKYPGQQLHKCLDINKDCVDETGGGGLPGVPFLLQSAFFIVAALLVQSTIGKREIRDRFDSAKNGNYSAVEVKDNIDMSMTRETNNLDSPGVVSAGTIHGNDLSHRVTGPTKDAQTESQ